MLRNAIAVCCLLAVSILQAQDVPHNLAAWIGCEMYLPFREDGRWGMLFETYTKGNQFVGKLQGSFYRIGVNWYLRNGNRFGAGYAYQWNLPYDEVALPYENPDNRIYEQFIWRIVRRNGDAVWAQRFRMEQRWLGRKDDQGLPADGFDHYKFENTLRVQVRYQRWFKPRWAWVAYDEVHLRTTAALDGERYLDQNRVYLGGAYALNAPREIRLELGYMNQSFWESVETTPGRSRVNHTIRITLTTDLPMHKAPKPVR